MQPPLRVIQNPSDTVPKFFFWQKIARSFRMGPTKLRYFVNFGIASYFKYILIESIKQSLRHIVSFEESLIDMTQSCEMDRYSHTLMKSIVKWKLDIMIFIFLAMVHRKIFKTSSKTPSQDLDRNKLFWVGMGDANVYLTFLQLIQQNREENQ